MTDGDSEPTVVYGHRRVQDFNSGGAKNGFGGGHGVPPEDF